MILNSFKLINFMIEQDIAFYFFYFLGIFKFNKLDDSLTTMLSTFGNSSFTTKFYLEYN